MAKKDPTDLSVEEKLKTLFQLQTALSAIDEKKALRGELPLEVEDLDAEIEGIPLADELVDISLGRMIGHTAHRSFLRVPAAARECQPQFPGHVFRVIKEHLIEISETEEQDGIRILFLRCQILLHHWSQWFHICLFSLIRTHARPSIPRSEAG